VGVYFWTELYVPSFPIFGLQRRLTEVAKTYEAFEYHLRIAAWNIVFSPR
jgi:hypothetical protein